MSGEQTNATEEIKQACTLLRNIPEIYMMMSVCTKMPFVVCDEETFDDEIFLFTELESAKTYAEKLRAKNQPVNVGKVERTQFLPFYSSLYTVGVNSLMLQQRGKKSMRIQLPDLVKRGDVHNLPDGKIWVENPGLHLSALYFMQELRRQKEPEWTEEMKELQEEILSDFRKGTFITAVQGKNQIPLLKRKDGSAFQPIFTDVIEFQKFNREKQYKTAVLEARKLLDTLVPEAKGVVINPLGVNLQLPITRKEK